MTSRDAEVNRQDRQQALNWIRTQLGATDAEIEQLDEFVRILLGEAEQQNLIAAATRPIIWSRHILDSAQLLDHVPRETSMSWIDLGSGAGLPGIVLAILRPADQFTLVERRPLRVSWLKRAIGELELRNARVCGTAVAAVPEKKFDVITARAFAPMPKLLAMAGRFATNDTVWLLPKGRSANDEVAAIPSWHKTFHVEPSVTDSESGILVGRIDPKAIGPKGGVRR